MSGTLPANAPSSLAAGSPSIELVLEARPRDLGGFSVRRALPAAARRLVGPFIFFDHFGPVSLPPGTGFDVRPHPHTALATVTYLFEGEIVHRDSLGSVQPIVPGDINWMLAGRGIVHSERASAEKRRDGQTMHGIQCWVALPLAREDDQPAFEHHPSASIPRLELPGARLEILAGTAYGRRSPVGVLSPTLYVHALLDAGARLSVDPEHAERAVYVAEGAVRCDGQRFAMGTMIVLRPGVAVELAAEGASRLMLVGGAALDGERHVYWNFVASSKERIERAKADWQQGNGARFPLIPGDDQALIPLPQG